MKKILLPLAFVLTAVVAFVAGAMIPTPLSRMGFTPPQGGPPNMGELPADFQGGVPQGFANFGEGERVSGEIVTIAASELVISNSSGELVFVLTEDTRYIQLGSQNGFNTGDFVQVMYQTAEDGTNTALSVETFTQE